MENNKYLDKVIKYLVRGTRLDYDREEIHFPFTNSFTPPLPFSYLSSYPPSSRSFSKYCKNEFGLTDEEIEYVWKEYRKIIKKKLKNGE